MKDIYARLPEALLPWYRENRRDLPWRRDREPYHVWLSEIMLQQTRAEAVKDYYSRFLSALPTVEALANADDDQLHKLWEGLGYYSRVRNLKKAAQMIVERYGGVFPGIYEEVLALPGVGPYTAGAICSIAFDLPTPGVDGNVLRVISRLTEDFTPVDRPGYKKAVEKNLSAVYPKAAGDFTQALMELGATLCGPNWKPDCDHCPCREICLAHLHGTAEKLPVKSPRKGKRQEEHTVFILRCGDLYALEKRPEAGLLAGLWQFPNVPGTLETGDALAALEKMGVKIREICRRVEKKHIFTHIIWHMNGFYLEAAEPAENFTWLSAEEIDTQAALPTAFRQFWEDREHV